MQIRKRQLCAIVVAQAACVAVGLWMAHHFVTASVRQEAHRHAWEDLEGGAQAALSWIQDAGNPLVNGMGQATVDRPGNLAIVLPTGGLVLWLDPGGGVVSVSGSLDGADLPAIEAGQLVSWVPVENRTRSTEVAAELSRGRLDLDGDSYQAVRYADPGGQGSLLFCLAEAAVEERAAESLGPLSLIGVLTLGWITILLAIVVHMAVTHFSEKFDRHAVEAAEERLRQIQDLVRARDAIIFGLAKLSESRDKDTGDHLERIAAYSTVLASELRRYTKYQDQVTPAFVRLIGISSALHDIGKVGVADSILLKPGPLTPQERARMQEHALIGARCLRGIEQRLGSSNFLQMAREIAVAHHERWDGTGYPKGLAGDQIPLAARIVAIADVYDALATQRCYKDARAHEECVQTIRSGAGTHFDPDLIEVWLKVESKFRDIARRYPAMEAEGPGREQEPLPAATVSAKEGSCAVLTGVVE